MRADAGESLIDALPGDTIINRHTPPSAAGTARKPLKSLGFEAFFIDGTADGIN